MQAKETYGVDSMVLRSSGVENTVDTTSPPALSSKRILWVGRIADEKRVEWLLDIAELCPDYEFLVVGQANQDSAYATAMLKRGEALANVEFLGRLEHAQIRAMYADCQAVCNTSPYEGFPNVFIEAWSYGVPVLTYFDPDGVVAKHGLGWVLDSPAAFADLLNTQGGESHLWQQASQAAFAYYLQAHHPDANLPKLVEAIAQL